jgi:hypothetical protein
VSWRDHCCRIVRNLALSLIGHLLFRNRESRCVDLDVIFSARCVPSTKGGSSEYHCYRGYLQGVYSVRFCSVAGPEIPSKISAFRMCPSVVLCLHGNFSTIDTTSTRTPFNAPGLSSSLIFNVYATPPARQEGGERTPSVLRKSCAFWHFTKSLQITLTFSW